MKTTKKDQGFTILENIILEELDLNLREQSLLIALISYENKEKGYAFPSYEQLKKRSKLKDNRTLNKNINSLIEKNLIAKETIQGKGCKYYITFREQLIKTEKSDLVENSTTCKTTLRHSGELHYDLVENYTTTNTKTNIKKNTIYDVNIKKVFEYWNDKDIIKHKNLNAETEKAISKALKKYKLDNIIQVINTYSEILKSEYYYDHRMSLNDFLTKKNGIIAFGEEGTNKVNYEKWKKKSRTNAEILEKLYETL